jgi:glutathione S-transferase
MGTLTLGVAATFCDFRMGHLDWRTLAPRVAALHEVLERRQSFIDTYPK